MNNKDYVDPVEIYNKVREHNINRPKGSKKKTLRPKKECEYKIYVTPNEYSWQFGKPYPTTNENSKNFEIVDLE